jgi:hypothetical protein
LEALDGGLTLLAQAGERGRLSFCVGVHRGDLVARAEHALVERLRALLGGFDLHQMRGDLLAHRAHPADQGGVGILDPAQVFAACREIVEIVGFEHQ